MKSQYNAKIKGNENPYTKVLFNFQVYSTSWDLLLTSVRIQMYILSTSRLPVKRDRSRKWREFVVRATAMTQSVSRTS